MTTSVDGRARQMVDPTIIRWASLFSYWTLVGLAFLLSWTTVDTAMALALAPVGLLLIEAAAKHVASRVVR